jgi:hypothetical protein
MLHLRLTEKQVKAETNIIRWNELVTISAEINEMGIEKNNTNN